MDIFDTVSTHINNSCDVYSDESCYCYNPLKNQFRWEVLAVLFIGSIVGWFQWIVIIGHFESFQIFPYRNRIWKCIVFVTTAITFFSWVFWSNFFMEKFFFDDIERTYMRWRLTFFLTGFWSLLLSCYFSKKNSMLILLLMLLGWSLIFMNLPLTKDGMPSRDRVLRLISPDYTFFVFLSLCSTFSHAAFIFNNWRSKFDDKKILYTMLKIFSFVWSATTFREYMKCVFEYSNQKLSYFWTDLTLAENKKFIFYFIFFVLIPLLFSWYYNYGQSIVDMSHIILCYITFHHIIYFFRVTIVYEEFSWAILDITEILLGLLFLLTGVWLVLYTNYDEPDVPKANDTISDLTNNAENLSNQLSLAAFATASDH